MLRNLPLSVVLCTFLDMRPQGIIYQRGKSEDKGELILAMPSALRALYYLARAFGAGLIAFAVVGVLFTYGPYLKEEINYQINRNKYKDYLSESTVRAAEAQQILSVQEEAEQWGVNSSFSIVIPKINASSNVIANVNPAVEEEYIEALKKGVAHASGTYFPGQGKKVYLFSHSTDSPLNIARYNAVFYLLRKLDPGDQFIVFFADKKYIYEVTEKLVTGADDVSWLDEKGQGEQLVLQTCDPPGTTWRRLIIVAVPID